MTFGEYAHYYEDNILSMGKVSSIRSTKSRLRTAVAEFGDKELPLDPMSVQRFVTRLSTKYPPQTVHNNWGAMRGVLLRAKADGLISEVPIPILPRIQKEEQDFFTPEEMRTLARYSDLYAVAAETGARVGELLAIQIQDIDLERKTLHVRRNIYDGIISTPKTRAGNRCLSISGWLSEILNRSMEARGQNEFLFHDNDGNPLSANRELEKLHHACDVFSIERKGFHAFRRGNCTILASVLGIAEKLIGYRMGHSSLGLTLGRYAKYLPGLDRDAAEKIGELLK